MDYLPGSSPDFFGYQNVLATLEHAADNTNKGIIVYPLNDLSSPQCARHVGYGQLLEVARQHANLLRAKIDPLGKAMSRSRDGNQPVVIIHFDSVLDTIEWYWAVLYCGGTPAITSPGMISNVEANAKAQLAHMKATLDNPICLTRTSLARPFLQQEGDDKIITYMVDDFLDDSNGESGKDIGVNNDTSIATDAPEHSPRLLPTDIAAVMFTSGSSGNAKAVPITHAQILAACVGKHENANLKFPDSPFLSWVNMDHVANLVHCHLFSIISGVSQIHVHPADVMADPIQFLNILSRHRVSRTFAPNFFLAKLSRLLETGQTERLDPNLNLEALFLDTGGEANLVEVCVALQSLLKKYGAPNNVVNPSFGMTETCAGCIFNNNCPDYDSSCRVQFASLGKPMTGVSMRVVKMESSRDDYRRVSLAAPGERGHLEVSGPAVFKGYYGNPQATREAFTCDGWFRTGDLAYLDGQRNLHLDGRTKELININGVKYLPFELDSALEKAELAGATPGYFCCFSTRDASMDTEAVVVVYLPSSELQDLEADDEARFATHSQIATVISLHTRSRPRVVALRKDQLPKSTLGKLSRAKLMDAYGRGDFASQQTLHDESIRRYRKRTHGDAANMSEREAILVDIIRSQLELQPDDEFYVNDSIISFGATSMDLMAIKSRINSQKHLFGITQPIDLIELLGNPTPRGILSRIDAAAAGNPVYDPVVVLQPHGTKIPLWVVHPGVGEVLVFVELARHMENRPLYAFRARGLGRSEKPFNTLDELFETYHAAIKKRQPEGPYAVAGYSFGGMVAFEVAKMLEAGGDEVRMCAPFNLPPHIKWRMRELVWDECVMHLFYFVELMDEAEIYPHKQTICELAQSGPDGQMDAIRYLKPYCNQVRWEELGLSEEDYLHWINIASNMQGLAVDYEPSGSVQSMDVFVADPLSHVAKNREDWINGRLMAWKDFVRGGDVEFHNVQGAHYTMLNPKFVNVSAFAQTLREVLAKRGI